MARSKWAERIAQVIESKDCSPFVSEQLYAVMQHLEQLRLEALEPTEREILDWIIERNAPVTSGDIATGFGIKQNHASGLLKALSDYGLLIRNVDINSTGRQFIYTVRGL